MHNQSRFAALSLDSDSDEDNGSGSMNEKSEYGQENGCFSITDAYQRSENNKKEHVYSVDAIRSIRHSNVHKDFEVITYKVISSSHLNSYGNRNGNRNQRHSNEYYEKNHSNRFNKNSQNNSNRFNKNGNNNNESFNRNDPRSKTTTNQMDVLEGSESVKEVTNMPEVNGKELRDASVVTDFINHSLQSLLEENTKREEQRERLREYRKNQEEKQQFNYLVTAGLSPTYVIKKTLEERHNDLSSEEIELLCSHPSILKEVMIEEEEERPWVYVDIHGIHKGPYTYPEMRLLWEEGLLSEKLLMKHSDCKWMTLREYYSNTVNAFIEEPHCVMKTIPKTVRSILKKKEIKPVGGKNQKERLETPTMESARYTDNQEMKSHNPEKMDPFSLHSKEKSKPEPEEVTPIPSRHKPVNKPKQLPVVHLKKTYVSSEPLPPEPQPITPPENAVSLDEALSLQTETMESDLKKMETTPTYSAPLPHNNKDIPTLSLERDAPRIHNETPLSFVEEAVEEKVEPPKPKAPIISPWTKQRLDQKPVMDVTMNYTDRIGRDIQEEPESVWKKTAPTTQLNYATSIGILLPIEEEKKSWKPVVAQEAIPLEELFQEEKLQKQQQKELEKDVVPKKKGKKGKREWKPVDLSFKSTPNPSVASATLPSGMKSFKEIQEEQKREQQKENAAKAQTPSRGNWGALFSSPLPALGSSKPTRTVHTTPTVKEEEESFWDMAKRKVEEEQSRKVEKREVKPSGNVLTRNEFDNWCQREMLKLSGSDDISLLDFCISLDDSQVLSYLQDYLGQSKDVTSFSKSFVQKRQHIVE